LGSALELGDEGGPRETEAIPLLLTPSLAPPERREREDAERSLSLSAMSVIATVARWAADRRGRVDMVIYDCDDYSKDGAFL